MSIVVWDGKTLAADKQTTNGNLRRTIATKIHRCASNPDILFAGVGEYQALHALRDWVEKGAIPADFPRDYADRSGNTAMWIINRNGSIARIEDGPFFVTQPVKSFADGSGRDFAYGALEMGADAVMAARIACHYDIYCGGEVDSLSFDD